MDYQRTFVAGSTLYHAGAPAVDLYLIRSGRVRLLKRVRGVERTIGWFGSEALIGEEALLDHAHRGATAEAVQPVTALVIGRDTFHALVRERPEIAEQVMAQLTRRLHEAEEQLDNAMLADPTLRVVHSLLRALDEGAGETLPISPVELSARTALSFDEVQSVVSQLQDRGYLRLGQRTMTVVAPDALRELYELLGLKDEVRHGWT